MPWITHPDPYNESWRMLLEFANRDVSLERISAIHGKPVSSGIQANYKKQAFQVRASLLQAKEYFDAATSSSLTTSPNHLYYGAVGLATAVMLILGDGTKSLDYLRQDSENRSHGLSFTTACTNDLSGMGSTLLQESRIEVLTSGFLRNWYTTLPSHCPIEGVLHTINPGQGHGSTKFAVCGVTKIPMFDELSGIKVSVFDLLKRLPDFLLTFERFGIASIFSRVSFEKTVKIGGDSKLVWRIHGAGSPNSLEEILKRFKVSHELSDAFNIEKSNTAAVVALNFSGEEVPVMEFPSIRRDLNYEAFIYSQDLATPEFADIFGVAFGLSMLSRYFPDLWVKMLESQCMSTQLVRRFLETSLFKLPTLALSLLWGRPITVSSNRPPYF